MIDPNVLVSSAIASTGTTAAVSDLIDAAVIIPIVSPALLTELSSVLERDKFRRYLTLQEATAFVEELERLAEVWDDPPEPPPVSRDPDDDYLIALARSADANALVSGDPDVNDLHLPDLPVLNPRQLLDRLADAESEHEDPPRNPA